MKKYLLIILSIFAFVPTFVHAEVFSYEYHDLVSDLTEEEKDTIVNTITSSNSFNDFMAEGRKYIIMYADELNLSAYQNAKYVVRLDTVSTYQVNNNNGQLLLSPSGFNLFYDENFNFLGFKMTYPIYVSNATDFYNNLIKSEVSVVFYNDFNLMNGNTVLKEIKKGELMQNLVIEKPQQFENNTIYEISVKILGSDIPEEFSWCYLVVSYLISIICVIVIVSPLIICIKLLGGV